jgi:sugar transferase (PEP-CTERM/EpsH1 system associated)
VVGVRVLFLVTRLPIPPWRGDQVRAFHHLRLLARRHAITCAAIVLRPPPPADVAALAALGVRVEVVPLGLAGAAPALARAVLGDPRPLQVLLFTRRRARAAVARLLARERFDVVHAQLVRTAAYLPDGGGPPVVLDLIDALSANFERRAARDRGPLALVSAWEAARLRRCEDELVRRAAATLVVAEPERAALGAAGVRVVPNGVDLDAFPFHDGERVPGRIVFAGNLGYFPNVDAAAWLVRDVLPRIRRTVPGATVRLVGARPGRAVRALAAGEGVTLAADVPAMAPEVAAASVAVIPMRSGSGLQNKVLEAMAVGTPVVTTPGVAAALAARAGEHLLVADDADGIAAAAASLLVDPARARALAGAARRLVDGHYAWERSADAVEAAWRDAAAAAAAPATRARSR